MNSEEGTSIDRRDWLTHAARNTVAGGIALLTGALVLRYLRRPCPDNSTPCRDCRLLAGCDLTWRRLPEADPRPGRSHERGRDSRKARS